jgi:hypothetical protein
MVGIVVDISGSANTLHIYALNTRELYEERRRIIRQAIEIMETGKPQRVKVSRIRRLLVGWYQNAVLDYRMRFGPENRDIPNRRFNPVVVGKCAEDETARMMDRIIRGEYR